MKGISVIVPALFLAISSLAMENTNTELVVDQELELIFLELDKKLSAIKDDEDALAELLRTDAMGTKQDTNSIRALARYVRGSPYSAHLCENLQRVILQIPKQSFESNKDCENAVAKFFTAILCAEKSFSFLAPILTRYELCIKGYFSEAIAHNKGLSFLFLFFINDLICEKAAIPQKKKSKKISFSISKKKENTDHTRENLTKVAKDLQKYVLPNAIKPTEPSAASEQINEILQLLKSKLIQNNSHLALPEQTSSQGLS